VIPPLKSNTKTFFFIVRIGGVIIGVGGGLTRVVVGGVTRVVVGGGVSFVVGVLLVLFVVDAFIVGLVIVVDELVTLDGILSLILVFIFTALALVVVLIPASIELLYLLNLSLRLVMEI